MMGEGRPRLQELTFYTGEGDVGGRWRSDWLVLVVLGRSWWTHPGSNLMTAIPVCLVLC